MLPRFRRSIVSMPMMQIRIMRMFVRYRIMDMQVRMPFMPRNSFPFMCVIMMPIGMLMVMDVFHDHVGMLMFMRKQIGDNNSQR